MFNKEIKTEIKGDGNIVIEGISNSTIIVNPNNAKELRDFLISFQEELAKLPTEILNKLKTDENDIKVDVKGIKMHLSLAHLFPNMGMRGRSIAYSVTITNFEKIHRYFKQPYFKLSKPFKLGDMEPQDTFYILQNEISKVSYPKRLEFGEQMSDTFKFEAAQLEIFNQINDGEQYLQAFAMTTLGELFSSNKYLVSELITEYTEFMGG